MTGILKSGHKRNQIQVDDGPEAKRMKSSSSRVVDYSDPGAFSNMLQDLDAGEYGSVTKDLQEVADMRLELVKQCISLRPLLAYTVFGEDKKSVAKLENGQVGEGVVNLDDDDDDDTDESKKALSVVPPTEIVILDSDDEDTETQRPTYQFQSSLVEFQKSQEDVIPVTPQFNFEEVVLGRGKETSSAIKGMLVSSFFPSSYMIFSAVHEVDPLFFVILTGGTNKERQNHFLRKWSSS